MKKPTECLSVSKLSVLFGIKKLLVISLSLSSLTSMAYFVDPFTNSVRNGWTDFAAGGSFSYAPHAFKITSSSVGGTIAYSKFTDATFTPQTGHTLEFRVNVNGIQPGGGATNGHAVLGWVPVGAALQSSSFSVSVGVGNVHLRRGSTSLYSVDLPAQLPTSNLVVALRITPAAGGSADIKATVYKQTVGTTNVVFEYTAKDTSGIVATAGNVALGAENLPSGAAASATFDKLQVFDRLDFVLDPLTGPHDPCAGCSGEVHNGWLDFAPAGMISEANNQLQFFAAGLPSTLYLSASWFLGKTFAITDGSLVQFSVDLPTGNSDPNQAPLLVYSPGREADLQTLGVYHVGQNPGVVAVGKSGVFEWVPQIDLALKNSGVRYFLTMTGEGGGTQIRIESRIEDLAVGVNDPNRVLFQNEFVDSTATSGSGPYINKNGYFGIFWYHSSDAATVDDVATFTNAMVSITIPANQAPIISNLSPKDGANFVDPSSTISFQVADDTNAPAANIVLTLNGTTYTNSSPGVTVTGSTTLKTFTLTGVLSSNVFYKGSISAMDEVGLATVVHYEFDTFLPADFIVEAEEFNYNGGAHLDSPILVAEGVSDPNAYNGVEGTPEVDFHDNRGSGGVWAQPEHVFRPDAPHTDHSADGPRTKYVQPGGISAGFYEVVVSDIANNDWMNYTHHYPAGVFNLYLRQSQYALPLSLVTLEKVTSDPTAEEQTNSVLGSFMQLGDAAGDTGLDRQRNVPLTDAAGQPLALRFDGSLQTLKLRDRYVDDGNEALLLQNYIVFVPMADPGILRPSVTYATPIPGSTLRMSPMPAETAAFIANRDTSVKGAVALKMNGLSVTSTQSTEIGGAKLSWSLADVPASPTITNEVSFADTDGTNITFRWTYSLPFLRAANRLPMGSLTKRGFDYRFVQADAGANLGNSLLRAEQQLAIPPQIPYDVTYSTNIQTLDWDISGEPPLPGDELVLGTKRNEAVEVFGYMQLTKGAHRFHVISDDGFQIRSGTSLTDPTATVMGLSDGSTVDGTFDFNVEADGLYPIRLIWYNNGPGFNFHLKSVNLGDSSETLVNDPSDSSGVVKVFLPATTQIMALSSIAVGGPYMVETTAIVDESAKTVTVPITGGAKFFRLSGPTATMLSARVQGQNLVIHYE